MKRNDARFVVFCFATAPVVVLFDLYLARKCFGGDRGEKSDFFVNVREETRGVTARE